MRSLQTSSQTPSETVRQFGDRLQSEARVLGDLFSHGELKSLFTQGLTRCVRSMFAASQPAQELDDLVPLSVLIGRAELVEDGVNQSRPHLSRWSPTYARPSPRSLTPRLPILATPEFDSEEIGAEEAACLAFQTGRVSKFGQPPKSESMTCYFCYRTGHVWSK